MSGEWQRSDEVVVATSNPAKLQEIRALFPNPDIVLVGLDASRPVPFPEEGEDYRANAIAKARAAASQLGCLAIADDSGLEVDALEGAPGPFSARFGGPDLDDAARLAALLDALEGVPLAERGARFVCEAALATPAGETAARRGECAGTILLAPTGRRGFGYDPVFQLDGRSESMAELSPGEKNLLSHRAQAFRALAPEVAAHLRSRA